MKILKILYWIVTGIMCFIFLFSAYNYFTNYEVMSGYFIKLGYPTYIVYPLAIAKILGVIAVLSKLSNVLKEWAYAGFFFDASLALTAHLIAEDGAQMFAIIALITTIASRILEEYVFTKEGKIKTA